MSAGMDRTMLAMEMHSAFFSCCSSCGPAPRPGLMSGRRKAGGQARAAERSGSWGRARTAVGAPSLRSGFSIGSAAAAAAALSAAFCARSWR